MTRRAGRRKPPGEGYPAAYAARLAEDAPPGEAPRESSEPAAQVLAAVWEHIRAAEKAVLDQTSIAELSQRTAPHEWFI